jgi:hypothetical protein
MKTAHQHRSKRTYDIHTDLTTIWWKRHPKERRPKGEPKGMWIPRFTIRGRVR